MKQWKIAISLAIAAAIAAPFVFGTWNRPTEMSTVVPLTGDERERYANFVANNCRKPTENDSPACWLATERLRQGGIAEDISLKSQYWAENAAAALAAFVSVFGLTFLLPALVRRYWRWLNT